jgi:hypothetical protein
VYKEEFPILFSAAEMALFLDFVVILPSSIPNVKYLMYDDAIASMVSLIPDLG